MKEQKALNIEVEEGNPADFAPQGLRVLLHTGVFSPCKHRLRTERVESVLCIIKACWGGGKSDY